jgi:hypothetical protein
MTTSLKSQSPRIRELCRAIRAELNRTRRMIDAQLGIVRKAERVHYSPEGEAAVIAELEGTLSTLKTRSSRTE